MLGDSFIDSNIFLYAASKAGGDLEKRTVARALISRPFVISSQVVQEFISNAFRKPTLGIGEAKIDRFLEFASGVHVLPVSYPLIERATVLRRRYRLSHWDSTIICAAMELDCTTLYLGDLTHGQRFGRLRVINPFLASS